MGTEPNNYSTQKGTGKKYLCLFWLFFKKKPSPPKGNHCRINDRVLSKPQLTWGLRKVLFLRLREGGIMGLYFPNLLISVTN